MRLPLTILAAGWLALGAAHAQQLDKVTFATNWVAQAEHGGFYQAVADGTYKKHGLDVTILPGGPNVNHRLQLIAGRVEFYMSANTLQAFDAVAQNIPTLVISAIFQKDPQVMIAHPGSGFDNFDKMRGRPLLISNGSRSTFWPYLRKKYGLSDAQLRPYNFNMAPFLADPQAIQQGFVTSEVYSIAQALGKQPEALLIADAGFSAYQTTIAISRKLAGEKKDLIQRFVDATLEGWAQYLKGGPAIEAANALIKKDNPEQTDDRILHAIKELNARGIVRSGEALTGGIGAMSDKRWSDFYHSMTDVGVLPPGLDVRQAYTLEFVNKGLGRN